MTDWRCRHGVGPEMKRGDCEPCNAEFAARPAPESMEPDARAEEVWALLNDPSAYRIGDIHGRLEGLVGRPVWTHEFATDTRLIEEARGALPHPADLRAHLTESMKVLAGDKPVIVIEEPA